MENQELKLRQLKEEIEKIEIIGTENEVADKYYNILHELAKKYGFEANTTDFDYERLYPIGYQDILETAENNGEEEMYNELVLATFEPDIEKIGVNEDDEDLYRLTIEMI